MYLRPKRTKEIKMVILCEDGQGVEDSQKQTLFAVKIYLFEMKLYLIFIWVYMMLQHNLLYSGYNEY